MGPGRGANMHGYQCLLLCHNVIACLFVVLTITSSNPTNGLHSIYHILLFRLSVLPRTYNMVAIFLGLMSSDSYLLTQHLILHGFADIRLLRTSFAWSMLRCFTR